MVGGLAHRSLQAYKMSSSQRRDFAEVLSLDPGAPLSLCMFLLNKIAKGSSFSSFSLATSSFAFETGTRVEETELGDVVVALKKATGKAKPPVAHAKAREDDIKKLYEWGARENATLEDVRIALVGSLSFSALLRVGETAALTWGDLEEEETKEGAFLKVHVRRAKNYQLGKGHVTRVALEKDSLGLKIYLRHKTHSLCLPSIALFRSFSTGKAFTPDTIRKELARACVAVGIRKLTPHELRGGEATTSIKKGASQEQVLKRWKSAGGMAPYLEDSLEGQGGALSL